MCSRRISLLCVTCCAAVLAAAAQQAGAQALTIYQIQYTQDPLGASPQASQIVDCAGGIVMAKYGGFKLTLQDPAYPDGWGGIQIKDWTVDLELFDGVEVGDRVSLANVFVEEYRGNTLLQYQPENSPGFAVLSSGNPLPAHKLVTAGEIAAPVEGPPREWYVADHSAEKYEAMLLKVEDVTVTAMDLGKARDNYNLSDAGADCWAADYINADRGDLYHPYVELDHHFQSVSGILEQYTKNEWDYYQLLTTATDDLSPMPGDADMDGAVDVGDLGILGANYGQSGKTWFDGDFTGDSVVNVGDLGILGANYGAGGGSSPPLPEPATIVLLAAGFLLTRGRKRR